MSIARMVYMSQVYRMRKEGKSVEEICRATQISREEVKQMLYDISVYGRKQ